jgi:hypothetical protein
LKARLTRDDAAVIYLNGAEVWRDSNLASGLVTNATPALVALGGADETRWLTNVLDPTGLIRGWNTLAAEVHNQSLSSSDIGFDFELTGTALAESFPALAIGPASGGVALSWPIDGSYFLGQAASNLSPPVSWNPVTNVAFLTNDEWRIILPVTTNQRYFRLRAP